MAIWQGTNGGGGGYGRTRRPKSITSGDAVAVVDNATLNDLNQGNVAARAARGYKTENQRYLHIVTGAGSSIDHLWVYSHAAGVWSEFMEPLAPASAIAVAAQRYRVIEIDGIDRVAFSHDDEGGVIFAACSTF